MSLETDTLLSRAHAVPSMRSTRRDYGQQHYELALAFLRYEITSTQFATALGATARMNNAYTLAFSILRHGVKSGAVRIG